MLDYIYGHDKIVADWVASMIPHCRRGFGEHAKAIGVIGPERYLIYGCVYHNYDPEAQIIEMSGAALPGRYWCTPDTLRRIYQYPFHDCDCQMIVQRVPADNERLLYILSRYDYAFSSVPRLFGRDRDGVVCTLTREAWAGNRFNKRFKHHVEMPIEQSEEAA